MYLQFQNDLVKKLGQSAVDSDVAVVDVILLKKLLTVVSSQMDPIDLRFILSIVGIDLRFGRQIYHNVPGRNDLPAVVEEKMTAALVNIKNLIVKTAGGPLDRKVLRHKMLIPTAVDKKRQ